MITTSLAAGFRGFFRASAFFNVKKEPPCRHLQSNDTASQEAKQHAKKAVSRYRER
jgi:hypothetical protein